MWAPAVLLVTLVPGLIFYVLMQLMPGDDRPRWRIWLANRLERLAARLRRAQGGAPPDPFDTYRVQDRLGVVARYVQSLEADKRAMARAERIIASQMAYDYLLEEACHLAGVDVLPHAMGDPAERFREEVELAGRGWAW